MPKSKNRRKPEQRRAAGGPQGGPKANVVAGTGAQNPASGAIPPVPATGKPTGRGPASEAGAKPRRRVGAMQFLRQVRAEGQKVTWTSRGETTVSTVMVLIMVAIMSLFFFLVDQMLYGVMPRILNLDLSF